MKPLFFLAFSMILTLTLYGQTPKVDHLKEKLVSVQGVEKVNVLLQLVEELRMASPKQAKDFVQAARKLSEKTDFSIGLMNSNYLLGELEKEDRHYRRAANRLKESVAAARKLKDIDGLLRSLELLKKVYILDKRQKKWVETEKEIQSIRQRVDLDEKTELLADLEQDYDKKVRELKATRNQRLRLAREKTEVEDELPETTKEKLRQEAKLALLAQEKAKLELATTQLEKEAAMAALDVVEKENALLQSNAKLKRQQFWQAILSLGLLSTIIIIYFVTRYSRLKVNSLRAIEIKNKELSDLMKYKNSLLKSVYHDLRFPVTTISNLSGRLKTNDKPSLIRSSSMVFSQIHHISNYLTNLAETVLSIERSKSVSMELKMAEHQVSKLVDEAIAQIVSLKKHGQVAFNNQIPENIRCKLDGTVVIRILVNLLSNSLKAIRAKQKKHPELVGSIDITTSISDGGIIWLHIIDNGIGMPQAKINTLLEKEGQILIEHEVDQMKIQSTGLGFRFCKLALKAHNSQLQIDSEVDKYTKVSFMMGNAGEGMCQIPRKTTSLESTKIQLTKEELERITPYVEKLKEVPFYHFSKHRKLLSMIELDNDSKKLASWRSDLRDALYSRNPLQYIQLLNQLND